MHAPPPQRPVGQGSVLLVTLFVIALLCLVLGSYLYLVRGENLSAIRAQAWNAALAVAEAGIEEGMAQLNAAFGTNNMASANANGWSGPVGGAYGPKTTMMTNGSYSATIDMTGPFPVVTATGCVTVPALSATLTRTVQVSTTTAPAFSGAMVALQNITFKGGTNLYVDSYDSSDPAHSLYGMYYYPWRKAGGDVASTYGFVSVGNATIKGKLFTGPTGSYSTGPNGTVGDLDWNGPGVEPGWYTNDFNMEFPDVSPPYDPSTAVSPTGSGTNTYVLGGSTYAMGDLVLKGWDTMLVTGNATLYVTDEVNMSGHSSIVIQSNASLTLYVGGANAVFTQVNTSGNASSFRYFGLPNNTAVSWSGNDQYVGTVYAPEAQYTLGGGGTNPMDYQGACVVQSVVLNGHFRFHYDEFLRDGGPKMSFVVGSWREL